MQADDGYLYPLERAFFYVHKPPTLIIFDEIESVEFMRQGGGLVAASVKTFDLNVRQKNDQVSLPWGGVPPHRGVGIVDKFLSACACLVCKFPR